MEGRPVVAGVAQRVARTCALCSPAAHLRYVTGSRREALARMGLARVRDVLLHVPHRYLDFSHVVSIACADVGQDATIRARVDRVRTRRPRPKLSIVELSLVDDTGVLIANFFRQPWIADQVSVGDEVAVSGRVSFAYGFRQMSSPLLEVLANKEDNTQDYARILPVHSVSEGLSVAWMRRIVAATLASSADVCDWLPASITARLGLMTLARALREVHFPATLEQAEQARRRLAFDELLCLQLALRTRKNIELAGSTPTAHTLDGPFVQALRASLPFSLTQGQEQAVSEIVADMAASAHMSRLLLGDVGTGKTAVAACALAVCADSGTQAAFMAPTSVLARQHAERVGPLLAAAGIQSVLITGSTPADDRRRFCEALADGSCTVAFGTTALLSDDVQFKCLSLVVIDEQHRFGVGQRAALRNKGTGVDLLAMTATPIPRTLALSLYGDVELSRLTERPHAGSGMDTKVIPPSSLDIAWGAIREALAAGHQAYVICPLVDEADDGAELDDVPEALRTTRSAHAATKTLQELTTQVFPEASCDLLTGKMSAAEKDAAMERFSSGKTQVLVATTVVEVGVDVPNATVMVVLDADRFGLATLHQLRGRVGRGKDRGLVYLSCSAKKGTPARKRLAALERTDDGCKLAELDLSLRREGEVLGYRQSGGVTLTLCDLDQDRDLVEAAHAIAQRLAAADPSLSASEHRALAFEVRDRFGAYFEELERS